MNSIDSTGRTIDVTGITGPSSPYPSATRAGDIIYVSGQVSFDEHGSVLGEGDVAAQTRVALERLGRVLSAYGATLEDVVSCTVYLSEASLAGGFNGQWAETFGDHRPSRATIVAELLDPRLLVEVQAVAHVPQNNVTAGTVAEK